MKSELFQEIINSLEQLSEESNQDTLEYLARILRNTDTDLNVRVEQDVSGNLQVANRIIEIAINNAGVIIPHELQESLEEVLQIIKERIRFLPIKPRLFISYAWGDDEQAPIVERLYNDLVERGYVVWWDKSNLPSRSNTTSDTLFLRK